MQTPSIRIARCPASCRRSAASTSLPDEPQRRRPAVRAAARRAARTRARWRGATRRRDRARHRAGAARARDQSPTSCRRRSSRRGSCEALAGVPVKRALIARARRGARRAARRAARARRGGRGAEPVRDRRRAARAAALAAALAPRTTSRSRPPRRCASSSRLAVGAAPGRGGRGSSSIGPVTSATLREHGHRAARRGGAPRHRRPVEALSMTRSWAADGAAMSASVPRSSRSCRTTVHGTSSSASATR